ncbi:unnamed protein product [Sphenostylis stenocarpa]|uniref:Uncharacterized protein n=1 Tax=Sphenostylis stenocarpa TaxID=92480 RepID=A0AA86SV49_9FABA|nr:unnamed protein product [Sphenostylis stenocarpa]
MSDSPSLSLKEWCPKRYILPPPLVLYTPFQLHHNTLTHFSLLKLLDKNMSSTSKRVETGSNQKGAEEDDLLLGEFEKKGSLSVTRQLCIKPSHNSEKLDKEVVLRRIRHRKRMNKVRSALGGFLFSTATTDAAAQGKKWVDDAFAAL